MNRFLHRGLQLPVSQLQEQTDPTSTIIKRTSFGIQTSDSKMITIHKSLTTALESTRANTIWVSSLLKKKEKHRITAELHPHP